MLGYAPLTRQQIKIVLLAFKSILTEAVVRRCSIEKVFFESQNSQETAVQESFFIKLQVLALPLY